MKSDDPSKADFSLTLRTLNGDDGKAFAEKSGSFSNNREKMDNDVEQSNAFDDFEESSCSTTFDGPCDEKKQITLAKNETRAVCCFRTILLLVLAAVATAVSLVVYKYTQGMQIEDFETEYLEHATKVIDSFQSNAKRRIYAIDSLSNCITSYAIDNQLTWPFVTLPDFERRAYYALDLAEVLSVSFFPIVTNTTRKDWESYAVENQGWIEEGLELQRSVQGDGFYEDDEFEQENLDFLFNMFATDNQSGIAPELFYVEKGVGRIVDRTPGPYAAWWQYTPVLPFKGIVNFNAMSNPGRTSAIQSILATGKPTISPMLDLSDDQKKTVVTKRAFLNLFLNRWKHGGREYQYGPMSDLYTPVFDNYDAEERSVVGLLTSYVYWQVYFADVLPDKAQGVMAILENTCNQTFSYLIHGPQAEYLGPGDMHDVQYDHLEVTTGFGAFLQLQDSSEAEQEYRVDSSSPAQGQCVYNVRVYPTNELKDKFMNNTPCIFAVALLMAFIFTSLIFITYDYLVERRQKLVMKTAVQSTEVVQSLFPAVVRDRLYEGKENETSSKKRTIKRFLKHNNASLSSSATPASSSSRLAAEPNMVIADLYENCTVLFCDIAGFTKWSSNREPTKVFTLLETLYCAFDKRAKKFGVFKIETIGDCYLAVTGLPDPQDDHALIMARFASDCLTKMHQMRQKLSTTLGPDTESLDLRYGLHSGPVTAGVLRGEKARFQLFGDTVNTASRMESTGRPGNIQASAATADLIIAAGKHDWIRKREDLVEVKGKGTLQTYWIEPKLGSESSHSFWKENSA